MVVSRGRPGSSPGSRETRPVAPHNRLFHTLHSDEADKRDLSPLRRAALLLTFPIVMALAVPVSLLLRLLVRAGTLIVVAWKPAA